MLIQSIKPGDRVEITLPQDKEDYNTYKSQVESILQDSRVIIMVPIYYGKLVKLKLGKGYDLLFFTNNGMVRFDATILKYVKQGDFYFMIVNLDSEGEKIQRREFFRFPCIMPMKFSVLGTAEKILETDSKDKEQTGKNASFHDAIIKDISGGGLKFVTNVKVEDKYLIRSILILDGEALVTIAKVLDSIYLPKLKLNYQYRCNFIGILPTEQDRIVQYIYNAQRKKLQVAPKKYMALDNFLDINEKISEA